MKKFLLASMLFLSTVFAYGQDYEPYAVNVEHVDSETGLVINPSSNAAKGRVKLKYSDGSLDRATRTPFNVLYDDLENDVVGVEEINPPVGYEPSHDINSAPSYLYIVYRLYCKPTVKVPQIPETVNFTYIILDGHNSWSHANDGQEIVAQHTGVRIGEYYWMNKNFTHKEPIRFWWNTIMSGDEDLVKHPNEGGAIREDNRFTQAKLDKYLGQVLLNKDQYQVDIEDFHKDFGRFYSRYTLDYMQQWGKISENGVENTSWGLPYIEDFRQLMGMCPFSDNKHIALNERDVRFALSPKPSDPMLTPRNIDGKCGSLYWFGENANLYGFNMMPSGARLNGAGGWWTNLCTGEGRDQYGNIEFPGLKGDIYHLFYTVKYPAISRNLITQPWGGTAHYTMFSLHDAIDTYNPESYHWMPIRWCRRLTDQELGYKLYITVKNINTSGNEWKALKDNQDELPLLNAIKKGAISADNVDIVKKGISDAVPAGYIELPKGYIRGFYVQYKVAKNSNVSIADIVAYAYSVQDNALGFAPYSKTRSAVAEVAAPAPSVVTIYPNPVSETLNVESTAVVKSIKIYNISTGALAIDLKNPTTTTINVGKLSVGLHVANIETESGVESHKFLKK